MNTILAKITVFFIALFLFVPSVQAAVVINEIAWMGTTISANKEWLELYNSGDEVNLEGWILEAEDSIPKIILSGKIAAQGFFLLERTSDETVPDVSADIIYVGAMSNAGEKLILKNQNGSEVDRVDGSDNWKVSGGDPKGNNDTKETAQRVGTGWITASPTPRAINFSVSPTAPPPQENVPDAGSSAPSGSTSNWPVEPQVFANAGSDRVVSVGADVVFEGKALGTEKKPLEGARYVWNFGDGSTKEGKIVSHVYKYPGEYTVILDVASGYFSGGDRAKVTAEESKIFISSIGDGVKNYIELTNSSIYEMDLSTWILKSGTTTFYLPTRTYIGGNKKLIIPAESSGITKASPGDTELLYPNGVLATRYDSIKGEVSKVTASVEVESTPSNKSPEVVVLNNETNSEQKIPVSDNTATVVLSENKKDGSGVLPKNYSWFFGILGVIVLSLIGASLVPKKVLPNTTDKKLTAKDFKIIEEE